MFGRAGRPLSGSTYSDVSVTDEESVTDLTLDLPVALEPEVLFLSRLEKIPSKAIEGGERPVEGLQECWSTSSQAS